MAGNESLNGARNEAENVVGHGAGHRTRYGDETED